MHNLVRYDYIMVSPNRVKKLNPDAQLDLSGILKGYIVDKLMQVLQANGVSYGHVQLGNHIATWGDSNKDHSWLLYFDVGLKIKIHAHSIALAISQHEKTYSIGCPVPVQNVVPFLPIILNECTVNPKNSVPQDTPQKHDNLCTAVVIAKDSATADAYATALIAGGLNWSRELLKRTPFIQAILIYNYNDQEDKLSWYASEGLNVKCQDDKSLEIYYP